MIIQILTDLTVSLNDDFCVFLEALKKQVVFEELWECRQCRREVVDTYLQGGFLEAKFIEVIRLESKQQIRAMERQKKAAV